MNAGLNPRISAGFIACAIVVCDMSGTFPPHMEQKIMESRLDEQDFVLDSQSRTVRNDGGSLLTNIPNFGVRCHDVEEGDEVTVHTLENDCFIIEL